MRPPGGASHFPLIRQGLLYSGGVNLPGSKIRMDSQMLTRRLEDTFICLFLFNLTVQRNLTQFALIFSVLVGLSRVWIAISAGQPHQKVEKGSSGIFFFFFQAVLNKKKDLILCSLILKKESAVESQENTVFY